LTDAGSIIAGLHDVDLVFHLASYSPRPNEAKPYDSPAHWSVTAEGTKHLVDAAIAAGVRQLVYVSSVKAMGDTAGANGWPANESTPERPDCLYGRAKLAAEHTIRKAGEAGHMSVSVLRLPMVYGLGGEGNLARMIDAVVRGRFPPWPKVTNRRSAVHVEDVIAAVMLVSTSHRAAGKTYLVTDGREYSTRWMYEQIRIALGLPKQRWTVPLWSLRAGAKLGSAVERLVGRRMPLTTDTLGKLVDDAWYSSQKIREDLSFVSSHRLDTEIPNMVRAYLNRAQPARSV
jgi:nucleoside-diphosphate-sugar epimerase